MKPWRIGAGLLAGLSLFGQQRNRQQRHWTEAEAEQWYAREAGRWALISFPPPASNELEIVAGDTFDPTTIDRRAGLGRRAGNEHMRVFLHYLAWRKDAGGFKRRIKHNLKIADQHHIKTLFVLFDSCWILSPKSARSGRRSLASIIPAGAKSRRAGIDESQGIRQPAGLRAGHYRRFRKR